MILTLHKVASPIFYQYITDDIFKQLVKQKYPLPATSMEAHSLPPLDYTRSKMQCGMLQDTLSDTYASVWKGGLIN